MDQDKKNWVEELKAQFEYLKGERAKREPDWKKVQRYVAPSVFNWGNPNDKVPKRPVRFTSRPTNFLQTLVSGITGYSISPNIVWQKLGLERLEQMDLYGVKDWLEEVERILYATFAASNLYTQTKRLVEYAVTYGVSVMLIEENRPAGKVRYQTIRPADFYLDVDEFDQVDTVFRYFTMTLRAAAAFFGEGALPSVRQEELKDKKNWNTELRIIHAVYKRQKFDHSSPTPKNMPYASVYIEEAEDHLLLESGYREFPYAVFTWDQVPGTPYGESPAIQALDDIKLLNKIDEARIKITQMSADPAFNVPDSMRSRENVVPRGYNYYSDPSKIMMPIQTGTNFPITLEVGRSIEERVKDWFHVDFFLSLQRENRPANMTATYVMQLQGEKAAVLSDMITALNGALTKLTQRTYDILYRQLKIPPPPDSLLRQGDAQLKVDFIGPLSQAQKKYHESAGIETGLSLLGAVAKIAGPAPLDVVDFDQVVKTGLEGAGMSQRAIREDADIAAIREERARMQAQARQQALAMEQQKNILGNLNKLNEPVAPGSPLAAIGQEESL
jgi:hypothetical protein